MSVASVSSRTFRWIALVLCLIVCGTAASAQTGNATTITGTVYAPSGTDPIPNILVYVAQTPVLPFSTTVGVGVTGGCAAQANLVSGNPLVTATTDYMGNFTLSGAGLTALGTTSVNIVIQAGKWRRQYPGTPIIGGQLNNIGNLAMPNGQAQGDLPKIAVVTGSADSVECIFNQIGILNTEITDPTGTGSINFYQGAGSQGAGEYINTAASSPKEAALVGVPATLDTYDVVIFGCQGTPTDPQNSMANQQNIVDYANAGGRVFATHYGYVWLDSISPFDTSADWISPEPYTSTAIVPAVIDQTYPEGLILANWLQYIGASYNGIFGEIGLGQVRQDTTAVNNPPAQSWVKLKNVSGTPSMQFTFNTPISNAGIPTVAITYTNNTTTFQPGDVGDSITIDVTNNSTSPADATLTLTISLPGGVTATSATDSSGGTWNCPLTSPIICSRTTPLIAGASDNVTLIFNIALTATLGQNTITGALSGGNLSSTGQCGRVLFNDYHVEQSSGSVKYPSACSTGLTAQERFLEFSLYNLSNFVAPTNTDVIDIQGLPVLGWTNPLTTISYGTTPWLTTAQLPTATFQGTNVAGTFSYTITSPTTGTITPTSILPVGTDTVCVTFAPTNTTNYLSVSTQDCTTIVVTPDKTTVTASAPGTIYYGQPFVIPQPTVTTAGPSTLNEGTLTYTISGPPSNTAQPFCTIDLSKGGVCTLTALYDAGTYTFQACYADPAGNFASNCAASYTVIVLPDPTSTTLASSANPLTAGNSVTFTAVMATTYNTTPVGTANFYDGTTLIQSVPLTNASATFTSTTLIVGLHSISVCYVPSVDPSGTYDFTPVPTCSSSILEQVVVAPQPDGTVTLLQSSSNPSIFGSAVTFTAAVATTGAFSTTPSGNVGFYDGTSLLDTAVLANGVATFTTSTLAVGTHPMTAVYAGNTTSNPTFAGSTSQPVQQVVMSSIITAGNGFLMQVNPTAISVGVGNTATVAVSIAALNNFNQSVQLSCSGLPNESTCSFAQSVIAIGGGKTTLTISPAAPHACGAGSPYFVATSGFGTTLPLLAIGSLGLFFVRKRKRLFQGLTLALALCLLPVINGCSSNCTDFGTQPATYTFTVTGTAMPATSGTSITQTSTQTIQMTVHL